MEYENDVPDKKDGARSSGNDQLKACTAGHQWTSWTQTGQRRIPTGDLLLLSGHEEDDASHREDVAFLLSRVAQRAVLGWEVHGP